MFIAGKARHRITLQKPAEQPATDGWGTDGNGIAYVDVQTVPAQVQPIRGSERMQADSIMAQVDHRVRLRLTPANQDADETWRVIWHREGQPDKVLDIIAAINVMGRGREWELMTAEHRTR